MKHHARNPLFALSVILTVAVSVFSVRADGLEYLAVDAAKVYLDFDCSSMGVNHNAGGAIYSAETQMDARLIVSGAKGNILLNSPVTVGIQGLGVTIIYTANSMNCVSELVNWNGKTLLDILGHYYGGKFGLAFLAGVHLKGGVNKNGIWLGDLSATFPGAGLDVSFAKITIRAEKSEIEANLDEWQTILIKTNDELVTEYQD